MRNRAEWADDKFREYLTLAEYREQVSSARPSLTGYSSSCCRAEVRTLRKREVVARVARLHLGGVVVSA